VSEKSPISDSFWQLSAQNISSKKLTFVSGFLRHVDIEIYNKKIEKKEFKQNK
jgi:hypothetical protein